MNIFNVMYCYKSHVIKVLIIPHSTRTVSHHTHTQTHSIATYEINYMPHIEHADPPRPPVSFLQLNMNIT